MTGIRESILIVCRRNTFFKTDGGYIGTGYCSIRSGDLLVLIPWLNCPMAIRPVGEKHQLVAPLYVHGMMKGEVWDEKISIMSSAIAGSVDIRELESIVSQLVSTFGIWVKSGSYWVPSIRGIKLHISY